MVMDDFFCGRLVHQPSTPCLSINTVLVYQLPDISSSRERGSVSFQFPGGTMNRTCVVHVCVQPTTLARVTTQLAFHSVSLSRSLLSAALREHNPVIFYWQSSWSRCLHSQINLRATFYSTLLMSFPILLVFGYVEPLYMPCVIITRRTLTVIASDTIQLSFWLSGVL